MYRRPHFPISLYCQNASSVPYPETDSPIYLQGSDNIVIPFPSFSRNISQAISPDLLQYGSEQNPIPTPILSYTLQILSTYVEILPTAARNIQGEPTRILENVYPITDVTPANNARMTILVHSLVKENILQHINSQNDAKEKNWHGLLASLYLAAFQLQIPSLIDCLASIIVDKIDLTMPQIQKLVSEIHHYHPNSYALLERMRNLEANYVSTISEFLENPKIMHTLLSLQQFRGLTLESMQPIQSYMQLRILNIRELTIADYIGLNGQPQILNGTLDLQNQRLSNLDGLKLILRKEEVTHLNLSQNRIMKYPTTNHFNQPIPAGFRSITILNLSLNQIGHIPPGFFRYTPNVSVLDLGTNMITQLSTNTFEGLSHLYQLNLSNNKISIVAEDTFHTLRHCTKLYLSVNLLTSLPERFFHHTDIDILYLDDNNLTELPENIFSRSIYLRFLSLDNNQLNSLPENLLRSCHSLKILDINRNDLSTLPQRFFEGLQLHSGITFFLYMQYNNFEETEQEFRAKHLLPRWVKITFDPQWRPSEEPPTKRAHYE